MNNAFPILLLIAGGAGLVVFLLRTWRGLKRFDHEQEEAEAQHLLDNERRHSLQAGDLSDCPRAVDRDGRETYAAWYYQTEAELARRQRMQAYQQDLLSRCEALVEEAKNADLGSAEDQS